MSGRSYLVTGGSKGVGSAVVRLLLDEGATVATCSRSDEDLAGLRSDLPALQDRLTTYVADVRDGERMAEVIEQTVALTGRLDGLVVNAGTAVIGDVLETDPATWDDQFGLKVHSVLNTVLPAVEHLSAHRGRVVVMNAVTARHPEPTLAAVSAARAALANVCQSLAVSLAPRGIGVVAVNLGAVTTERQRERYAAGRYTVPFDVWSELEARRRGVLLGRMAQPDEVAPAVAFLLSPLAGYTTGTALDVAGGMGMG
jgi:NAD(P)-dependent dehydrogenase (short-subunit alcohol dehydrogenase family)